MQKGLIGHAGSTATVAKAGGLGIAKILGILVTLVVVGGVGTIAYNKLTSPSPSSSQTYLPNTNTPIPAAFTSAAQSSQSSPSQTTGKLAKLAASSILNNTQLSVTYAGSFYLQPSGTYSILSVSTPISAGIYRYKNELKLLVNATSIPILGAGKLAYLNLSNGAFLCTNINSTSVSNGNFAGALSGNHNITCRSAAPLLGINLTGIANMSPSSNSGFAIKYNAPYHSMYNGSACTYFSGTLSQTAQNNTQTGSGTFGFCLSDANYLPLALSFYFKSNSATVALNLNATNVGGSVQKQYVEQLPGTLVK